MSRYIVPEYGVGSTLGFEEAEAVVRAMQQDTLTWGPCRDALEAAFAEYVGMERAVAVSSCTAALEVATETLGLQAGDEVITTPQTFIATVLPLLRRRVRVVFADIDPLTLNIDPATIEAKITSRTRAVYVTHYGGLPCDLDAILDITRRHGLRLVQDAAHAPGAESRGRKIGADGDFTCFSFHSLKNMTTLGEGGMLVAGADDLDAAARKLRSISVVGPSRPRRESGFGPYAKPDFPYPTHDRGAWDIDLVSRPAVGNNYRMNEVQAAAGLAQLRKLDGFNQARRRVAHALNAGLSKIDGITVQPVPEDIRHVYHLYTAFVEPDGTGKRRDRLIEFLDRERGIQIIQRYFPLHLGPEFRLTGHAFGECPVTERVFFESQLNLPIHPALTQEQVCHVIQSVRDGWARVCEGTA